MKDYEEKYALLKMVYDTVEYIGQDKFFVSNNNKSKVIDSETNTIIEDTEDKKLSLHDKLVAIQRSKDQLGKMTLINFYNNRTITGVIDKHYYNYNVIIVNSDNDKFVNIYNNNLDLLLRAEYSSFIVYNVLDFGSYYNVKYTSYKDSNEIDGSINLHRDLRINKYTGQIYSYGYYNLTDDIDCIATEIDTSNDMMLKYKLFYKGNAKSDKTYHLIKQPNSLSSIGLFYTYNKTENGIKRGIIRLNGSELLDTIYDDITYVGNKIFILSYKINDTVYKTVFNSDIGSLTDFYNKDIISHETLPLLILYKHDNSIKLLNTLTYKEFNIENFKDNFECYYCKEDNKILRVRLKFIDKYIYTNLVAITNFKEINKIKSYTWIHM